MERIVGVLLAGGHGTLRADQSTSKLLESAYQENDTPLVRLPLECLRGMGLRSTYVIVNGRYGDDIRSSLSDHPEDHFVRQSERSGTAGAVKLVLDVIDKGQKYDMFGHMVVLYGDMPCWRRESIEYLVTSHLQHRYHPAISMFRIQLNNCCPELVRRYGRILYDVDGELIGIREPYEMTSDELCRARTVNPSAWVFDLAWLRGAIYSLEPHDKGDGFAEEYWLPDLAPIAILQKRVINVLPLTDPREALGVNTLEELFEVQQFLTKQRGVVAAI